jgi:hypothetical protein
MTLMELIDGSLCTCLLLLLAVVMSPFSKDTTSCLCWPFFSPLNPHESLNDACNHHKLTVSELLFKGCMFSTCSFVVGLVGCYFSYEHFGKNALCYV